MSLIPLGTINGLPSTNTSDPYYLPPTGYYQNDAGALVPMNTLSAGSQAAPSTSSSSSPSWLNYLNPTYAGTKVASLFGGSASALTIEDYVFILLGVVLIIAGVFGFDKTQSVIVSAGTTAAKTVKGAGEVVAA
jgi:hypothetical protein